MDFIVIVKGYNQTDVKGLLINEVKLFYGTNWIIFIVQELE